jgi:hypothetical protein
MGNWELAETLSGEFGADGYPVTLPFTGTLALGMLCMSCPVFLRQAPHLDVAASRAEEALLGIPGLRVIPADVLWLWVEFEVELETGRTGRVWRVSDPMEVWIEEMRRKGELGPMTLPQALAECEARRRGGPLMR